MPVAALIPAAISLASSLYGGYKSSQAAKEANALQDKKMQMYQNWYDREYNADPTQRADAMLLLNRTAEMIRDRNKRAAGTAAVAGGTEESVAATKQANAKAMSDAVGQIAAANEARKDGISDKYMTAQGAYYDKKGEIEQKRAENIAKAAQAVSSAASSAFANLGNGGSNVSLGYTQGGAAATGADDLKTDTELANEYNLA